MTEFLRAISGALAGSFRRELQSGGADFRNTSDANALHGRFHGLNQRDNQLVQSNQAKAQRGGASEREPLTRLVEGQQQVGPAVAWSEHIPGPEDSGIEKPFLDHKFALGAHGNVVLHHGERSGVGDADIDEMAHAEFGASGDGFAGGDQVNGAKLGGFRRRRMRDANQVDEGVGRANELAVAVGVEHIAGDNLACAGQLGFRPRAYQYANPMATLEKNGNETAADIPGSSRQEDAPGFGRPG